MHQEVLGFGEVHLRVPVLPEILLVLPGLKNWALVAHVRPGFEVLLDLVPDVPVTQVTLSVLGFADLSKNTAPKEAQWGLPRTWSSADFSLYLTKQKGSASALPNTSQNLSTSPNPLKYSRRASFEASSGKSLNTSSSVLSLFAGSAIWVYE